MAYDAPNDFFEGEGGKTHRGVSLSEGEGGKSHRASLLVRARAERHTQVISLSEGDGRNMWRTKKVAKSW